MVIDSSAVLAILLGEPDAEVFASAIESAAVKLISAVNHLECAMVVEARKGPAGGRELDLLLHRASIEVVSFTEDLAGLARSAWRDWGKGRHPAALNFCDCCSYALAVQSGFPLLFKGSDFSRTDVTAWKPL